MFKTSCSQSLKINLQNIIKRYEEGIGSLQVCSQRENSKKEEIKGQKTETNTQ